MPIEFLAVDTETTGLSAEKSQIIEISMLMVDGGFNVIREKHIYALPDDSAFIDPKAVEVNGYSKEKWVERGAVTQAELFKGIVEFVKDHRGLRLLGHNVSFDRDFLKQLFFKFSSNKRLFSNHFHYHLMDSLSAAMFVDYVKESTCRESYKLVDLCKAYHITHEKAHTAKDDIMGSLLLIRELKSQLLGTATKSASFTPGTPTQRFSKIIAKVDSQENTWVFTYGEHKGKTVSDIIKTKPDYISFVLGFTDLSPEQRSYLEEIYKSQ